MRQPLRPDDAVIFAVGILAGFVIIAAGGLLAWALAVPLGSRALCSSAHSGGAIVTFRAVSGSVMWDSTTLDRESVMRLLGLFERAAGEAARDGDRPSMLVAASLWAELHCAAVSAGAIALRPSLDARLDGASGFYVIG